MANLAISFFLLLGFIVAGTVGGSILCVKCKSNTDKVPGDCEKRPPSPTTCYAANVEQYCIKVIEYNADNTQRLFVRDCTSLTKGSSCSTATEAELAAGAAAKVCHEVCKVDGCNDSVRLSPSSLLSLSLLCLIVLRLHPLSIRL